MPRKASFAVLEERSIGDRNDRLFGPNVWPRLSAEHVVDRVIQRWVEIGFDEAKRRMKKEAEAAEERHPDRMKISVRREWYVEKKGRTKKQFKSENIRSWVHVFSKDEVEDTTRYLHDFRDTLWHAMPDRPLWNEWIQVTYYHPETWRMLVQLRYPWN